MLALATRQLPLLAWTHSAASASPLWRHGTSPFGQLKYPAGFRHFDYVNPEAPKGGVVRQAALGTFDNFNMAVAGIKGMLVLGIDLVHNTLMVPALDEVSSEYGMIAEAVSYPDDFSSASYRLRPQARWHDGQPVTPDDVIFSFNAFKTLSPQAAADYLHVVKVEKTGERQVTFTFNSTGNRKLLQVLGQLTILSKHWWEGADKDGKQRDIGSTTLEPPLGSGPYRIKEFISGRSVVYERVKNYWGQDLNVSIGRDNFDEIRFEYFRDATVAIEAFKADVFDWRIENSAKNWATSYDFPAVKEKRVILEEFPINNIGIMQGFAFNIRRGKFSDPRVRLALNYAFNFEEMNKQIFFDQYKRIASYFEGTELAARGLPSGRELELLETVRNTIPAEIFKKPYSNPNGGHQADMRSNLREAGRLLKEAGYEVRGHQLVHGKTGEPFTIELLTDNALFERVYLVFKPSLERLGFAVSVRTVDRTQYENRMRNRDFDIITFAWGETLLPGNELRGYFGSQAADQPGSFNVIGIKNPAVDAMIEHVIFAKSHEELVSAARALDRVLLWNHYVIPQWTYNKIRTARWDRFSRPDPLPKYAMSAFPSLWWWDAAKAAKAGNRQ
jgi:microcin C transport system substrate-binding protein